MTARPDITPVYDHRAGRVLTEADVVWEEVDEHVDQALRAARYDPAADEWVAVDLGAYCRVTDEVTGWNPAAREAFCKTLKLAMQEAQANS